MYFLLVFHFNNIEMSADFKSAITVGWMVEMHGEGEPQDFINDS